MGHLKGVLKLGSIQSGVIKCKNPITLLLFFSLHLSDLICNRPLLEYITPVAFSRLPLIDEHSIT